MPIFFLSFLHLKRLLGNGFGFLAFWFFFPHKTGASGRASPGLEYNSVEECLLSMCETLDLIPTFRILIGTGYSTELKQITFLIISC